jgi:hypothetical protein
MAREKITWKTNRKRKDMIKIYIGKKSVQLEAESTGQKEGPVKTFVDTVDFWIT